MVSFQTTRYSKLWGIYFVVLAPDSQLNGCSKFAIILIALAHVGKQKNRVIDVAFEFCNDGLTLLYALIIVLLD